MTKKITLLLAVMFMAELCSCQSRPLPPLPAPGAGMSVDSATLGYELASRPWCTNQDAASMVLLMMEGEDRYQSFDERLAVLENRGWIQPGWNLRAEDSVTKGTLAYMVCAATETRGGVMMHLLPSRRYAYIEAVHLGYLERGSENEPVTGPEALGVFGRVTRHNEEQ